MNAQVTLSRVMTPRHPRWDEFTWKLGSIIEEASQQNVSLCSNDLFVAARVLRSMASIDRQIEVPSDGTIDIPASLEFFRNHGGHCDCEVLMNVDPKQVA